LKFSSRLDVDVVAHESTDEVALLVDLEAPALAEHEDRAPATVQVVLDRSGSMSGRPLAVAIQSLVDLVAKLDARDRFGVVIFDDKANVVVPCGPVDDKERIVAQVRSIVPGGMTDLSAGLLRGLREIRRVVSTSSTGGGGSTGEAGATLLLISDGHANQGVTDHDQLAGVVATAFRGGVVTSTVGMGLGYDESLLAAISSAGAGNHSFADEPDAAGAAIAAEIDGLLKKTVQAATMTVAFEPSVQMLRLYNDLPAHQLGDGLVQIELGDLYATEARKVLLRLEVPAMAALGVAQVATLTLEYVELPALLEHTVRLPVTVNVVPGDEAAGRVADPSVRTEVLFQEAQLDKLTASEALERGDRDSARKALHEARAKLEEAGRDASDLDALDVQAEYDEMGRTIDGLASLDPGYLSKRTRESFHNQNRKRGRRQEGDT
jgi:Ca-activated chloride channel family protein